LADLQVGGSTRFKVEKSGTTTIGAVLQGITGISGQAVLETTGTCPDLTIEGHGIIDGGNIASVGFVDECLDPTDRVKLFQLEVRNNVNKGIVSYDHGIFEAHFVYVHDNADQGIQNIGDPSCVTSCQVGFYVTDSRITNLTSVNSQALACSDALYCQFLDNVIDTVGGTGLYAIAADRVLWRGNRITNFNTQNNAADGGIHCDTCGAGEIAENQVDTGNGYGIFPEVTPQMSMHDNWVYKSASDAYRVGAAGTNPTTLNTQIDALDATAGLTAGTNITLGVDSAAASGTGGHQEGTNAVTLTPTSTITAPAILAYHNFGSRSASYPLNAQFWEIDILSAGGTPVALSAGQLQLIGSTSTTCATADIVYNLPYIPASTWVLLKKENAMYQTGWDIMVSSTNGITSWCLKLASGSLATTAKLWIDDYRINKGNWGISVAGNKAISPGGDCFQPGMLGGELRDNYCSDAQYNGSGARFGYLFAFSTPQVKGNECNFTAKAGGQASTCLYANDSSTTLYEADTRSNADNISGGTGTLKNLLLYGKELTNNAGELNWTGAAATAGSFKIYDSGGTNNITDTVIGTVTSYTNDRPLVAASGVQFGTNASNTIQQNFSGDSAHSLSQLAKTAAVTTFTLCAATANTACGQAGQYRISYNFYGSGTACSAVTAGSVGLNLTWTDTNAVAHTTISMPMWDQKSAAMTNGLFNFNTALGTEGASGSYIISTNGTIIQAATTYTACTTGTGTYNLKMTVEQLQ
jgi:hypothetical protein